MFTSGRLIWVILLGLISTSALAADEAKSPPKWYEIASGVIAVPAAMLGLIYTWVVIQKARVEIQKTRIEIEKNRFEVRKLQQELASEPLQPLTTPKSETAANLVLTRTFETLMVRFVVLWIILQFWGLVEQGWQAFFSTLGALVYSASKGNRVLGIPLFLLYKFPSILYWAVIIGLGWPIFVAANDLIGVDVRELFRFPKLSEISNILRRK